MPISNKSIMSLLAAGSLLFITAVFLYAFQLGLFDGFFQTPSKTGLSRSEIRAAYTAGVENINK